MILLISEKGLLKKPLFCYTNNSLRRSIRFVEKPICVKAKLLKGVFLYIWLFKKIDMEIRFR